jgi:hypothetical protein
VWEVSATFSTDQELFVNNTGVIQAPQPPENPLDEAPKRRIRFRTRRVKVAGQFVNPLSPPIDGLSDQTAVLKNGEFKPYEVDIDEPILVVVRNLPQIDPIVQMRLSNNVNATPYFGARERQLRLGGFETEELWHHVIGFYVRIKYEVAYKFDTWDIRRPEIGSYYLDSSGNPVFYPHGANPIPVNLTSTGGKLSAGTNPIITSIRYYREIDFSPLGLL